MNKKSTDINVRLYGKSPYRVAVLHGGPGAPGYMAPVARKLCDIRGVMEPLQSAASLDGQIDELRDQLTRHGVTPLTLIGSSWGAVLTLFFAARYPETCDKLILIGPAVFDAEHSAQIEKVRLSRLSDHDRRRYDEIQCALKKAGGEEKDKLMSEWGRLLDTTDMYDPITIDLEVIETQYDIFSAIWPEFTALRDRPGYLKNQFSRITAPVIVIHGDYDPHPLDGIRPFLEGCLESVTFHILPHCGHYPWIEREAKDLFFGIIENELAK